MDVQSSASCRGYFQPMACFRSMSTANYPVAVIKSAQIMRIITVSQICSKFNRPRSGGATHAPNHRPHAVCVFPGHFDTGLQFFHAHMARLKYHVLAIVEFPVLSQYSTFRLQAVIEWSIGKWSDHGK